VLRPQKCLDRGAKVIGKRNMRSWLLVLVLITGFVCAAFGRLGDTEKQLTGRYGKPVSVRPGGKYNPYFDKLIDFQKEGIAISCGMHAGRCVTIEYTRESGFKTTEFEGFTLLNSAEAPAYVQRSATSLKFTLKKDYPEIVNGSKKGIRKMRKDYESFKRKD
jgi:hypothetical protein